MVLGGKNNNNQFIFWGVGLAGFTSFVLWYFFFNKQTQPSIDYTDDNLKKKKLDFEEKTKDVSSSKEKSAATAATPSVSKKAEVETADESKELDNKAVHAKIEELDKKGKALFKAKEFFEAAQTFTEALDYIDKNAGNSSRDPTSSLFRQIITLLNNRSAMYEKGGLLDLALDDCDTILTTLDMKHTKARTRKIRILENNKKHYEALVEVCCTQLIFMQENRDKFRLGLPVPNPPIPQSKLEELMNELTPIRVTKHIEEMKSKSFDDNKQSSPRPLPSSYTLLQLLKSYSGYNAWMALAAKSGSVESLTTALKALSADATTDIDILAQKVSLLMKRGRRHVYDGKFYDLAVKDFEEAYGIIKGNDDVLNALKSNNTDDYARLLEWTGMVRHWSFDLDSAMACYAKCSELEPTNSEILVKQAGVKMDGGNVDEALKLFDRAIGLNPGEKSPDALLHRANLYMLQQKTEEAKVDLLECLKLRPNHVLARLRLAAIYTAMSDIDSANKYLDEAEEIDSNSSEIYSYRGEIAFTRGEFGQAKSYFEQAIKLEPNNATPYVNMALAILNAPITTPNGQQQPPDAKEAINYLQKAIDVDPMFHAAYVQLGQLKLGTATDLNAAREVIQLYDQGLQYSRSPEELKDLYNMRILTEAQVDAATQLKMETFSMQ